MVYVGAVYIFYQLSFLIQHILHFTEFFLYQPMSRIYTACDSLIRVYTDKSCSAQFLLPRQSGQSLCLYCLTGHSALVLFGLYNVFGQSGLGLHSLLFIAKAISTLTSIAFIKS